MGFLVAWCALAQGGTVPDPAVAAKLGLNVQQLHDLRARFDLSNDGLLALTAIQLQTMLLDLEHPGIDKHAEEQKFRALRMMDEHGRIPPDGLLRALEHRRHVSVDSDLFPASPDPSAIEPDPGTPGPLTAGIQTNGWTWLGPGNIGGRVRAMLAHPTFTNILWCGGVDGGVWKTTNSGAAWFPLNDFMANLAVACMVMDPSNPDVIYAGTGEGTYNLDAIRGAGIFKTTDGGGTWSQLSSTANASFQYVSRLAIDPNDSQVILAATRSGIFRSADGGDTWSQPSTIEVLDVAFHPTDSSQCIASGYNGKALYSPNGGLNWSAATGLPAPAGFVVGRVEVAYSRSSPSTVFASMDNHNGEVYRSVDGGHSYSLRNSGNNYLGGQGWYGNALWVDPTTTNVLIVGGIDLWRSADGGATLTKISEWQSAPISAHADHHVIVHSPAFNGTTVKTVFFGNDGGVYRALDAYNVSLTSGWQELNNNLGITEFYGGAGNSNTSVIVGGTQDNGTLRYSTNGGAQGWTAMFGGDGGFAAADQSDANYFYGEYVYLEIHRSANGGLTSSYIYSGISDAGRSSGANFIAPFILDPNNPNTMLAGGLSLWRSSNVKAASPSWSAIKPSSTGVKISAIAVAPGDSDVIWVGYNNGDVYSTTNGTATSPTWNQRDLGTPNLPNRYCERIAVEPNNSSRVYVTFGGFNADNVWRTSNNGLTWSNITANLPAAPVNSIVIAPTDTNTLYVGTEVGVFGSSDGGGHWSTGNDGPANVAVDELFWLGNKLVAVTHGRGMFYIAPALGGPNLFAAGSAVIGGNGNGWVDPNECNQVNLLVQNVGGTNASNINATLTTSTPGVSIIQGASTYPDLPSGALATNLTPFQISSSPSYLSGTPVALTLNLTFNGGNNTINYNLPSGSTNYTLTQTTGASIVAGTTDVGNHEDDVTTTILLPFAFSLYGQAFSSATLDSNGKIEFSSASSDYLNSCLPASGLGSTIFPFWDDLRTDAAGSGIFTSTSGSAPNRIFNIEWRATYYSGGASLNFEVRLYEGSSRFDIIYGALNGTGSSATVGLQSDNGAFSQFECNAGGLSSGLQLSYQQIFSVGGGECAATAANFTASPTSGVAPLTVFFTNLSSGASSYSWDFGDGNISAAASPVNTYSNAGSYTVSLTAASAGGTNTLTRTNYIAVTSPSPVVAAFVAGPTSGVAPLTVFFTNLSSGATSYSWDFGDGNISVAANPVNTYSNSGIYTISLTAASAAGTNTLTRTNYVVVTNPPPVVAAFTAGPTSGVAPLTVFFTNLSSGASGYSWDFGDGNASAAASPVNTYSNAGSYTISLTAAGVGGTNTLTRINYVVVTNPPSPVVAAFTAGPTSGVAPLTVFFTNLSSGASSYIWDFGDGNATAAADPANSSTAVNPVNTYTNAGSYTVSLTAIGIGGTNNLTRTNYIVVTNTSPTNNAGAIAVTGVPYIENFDSMGPNGTNTPPGWYVGVGTGAISGTNVTVSSGAAGSAGNYNFGSSGSSDRALGSLAANSTQRDTDVRFMNVAGSSIASFVISYSGEHWRVGGQSSGSNALVMQYSTDGTNYTAMGAQFDFNAPLNSGSAKALDGNAASNRVTGIGGAYTPAVSITNGQVFYLRWADAGHRSAGDAMAIDDLAMSFTLTNAPAPAAGFSGGPTSGVAPLTVFFMNLSSGATSYSWDFGDGNTSASVNPANSYSNAGSYTVSLTASGPGGTSTLTRTNYVVVTNPPPPVVADFAAGPTNGVVPLTVVFTNLSSGATKFIWDFGDGNTSASLNPENTYTNAGSYTVSLIASGPGGSNTLTRTNFVVVTSPPPQVVADFAAGPTNGLAPLTVVFTNLSSGATDFIWDFGDGKTSAGLNPTNIYTNAGSYTVSLTASGAGTTNTLTRTNYVVVTNPPPQVVADFAAGPTSGVAPLTVVFTNLSSGATDFIWDFGDGNSSASFNPTNTYTNAGSYTVSLTANSPGATNTLTRTNYVVVTNSLPSVVADFAAGPTSGVAPLTVVFTNLSSGATDFIWDFGDGNTSASLNPTNTYTNAGSYTVSLTASSAGVTNSLIRTNCLVVTNPVQLLVTPTSLDFGLMLTGTGAQATLVLSNAGSAALDGQATITPSPFAIESGSPFNLEASAWTNLVISFTPVSSGLFSNVVVIVSNGGDFTNSLVGRAINPPLLLSPALSGADFTFSFATATGFTYLVQYKKDSLEETVWQTLQSVAGDGTVKTITRPLAPAAQQYFRLVVQ